MRTHTQDFKDDIKAYGREFNDTIKIYDYANGIQTNYYTPDITQENINSVNYSFDGGLLKSVMQTLTCDINKSAGTWIKEGRLLVYQITLGNQSLYYSGIINKIEEQKDTDSLLVTCYDDLILSMVDYETPYTDANRTTRLTFPTTLGAYLSAICNHLGIVLQSSTFTNSTQQVTSEHYLDADGNSLGYTFRDVLDDIAEASGSFISVKNYMLHVHTPYTTSDTIDDDYLKDTNVTINKKYGPINVVVLSRNDVDNLVKPTTQPQNPCEIKISNNPILDQTNRGDFIDGIYNNLNGLEFYLNDMQSTGILYYEIGDKYNVTIDNTTYPCLMLNDSIKRENGLSEYIYTDEPQTSVTEYKYASTTDKIEKTSRNAYFLADKANGTAEMIVSGIGSNGQVTGASVIGAINGDTSSLTLNADKINLNGAVTANNNFIINNDGSIQHLYARGNVICEGGMSVGPNQSLMINGYIRRTAFIEEDLRSRNMFNKNYIEKGKYIPTNSTSETLSNDTNAYTTHWINCEEYQGYIYSGTNVNKTSVQCKDTNGNITYIEADNFYDENNVLCHSFNASADAIAFRIYFYNGNSSNFDDILLTVGIFKRGDYWEFKNYSYLRGNDNNGDYIIFDNDKKYYLDNLDVQSISTTGNATISGNLTTTNREDSASKGWTYDQYGNMQHKTSSTNTPFNIKDNSGNYVVRIFAEDTPKRVLVCCPSLTITEGNVAEDATNSFQTTLFGSNNAGYRIKSCRAGNSTGAPTFGLAAYSPTLAIATEDTHMFLSANYVTDAVVIGAGNADKINWKKVVLLEGDTLVSTAFNIGSSVTINNLSSYKFLEIFYGRGNDYGQASQKVLVASNTMTNISIMYISGSDVRRHTAHVSWSTSTNKVTFVSMLEERITTSGLTSSIVTSSNSYDKIVKIIGYKY